MHWLAVALSAHPLDSGRNSRDMSRTCASAAELFYLRHTRSCAATACGKKKCGTSHSIPLQMFSADFIARLLQSILHSLVSLLQIIGQMVLYYAKIAKTATEHLAALCTPLELAACLHLVEAYMHRDLYTYHCESDHCGVSAVSAPSAQKIATIALALLILSLSIIDWHVPRCFRSHQLLCRILTAISMQALRMDLPCTAIAFLLSTFG